MQRLKDSLMSAAPTVLLAALTIGGCSSNSSSPLQKPPRELTKTEARLVEADNGFGFALLKQLNSGMADSNVFVSPVSVAMALGMTLDGARGQTQTDMARVLGFDGMSQQEINEGYRSLIDLLRGIDPKVKFQIANSIWYRDGLQVRSEFVDHTRQYFDAGITSIDFGSPSASPTINGWVKNNTGGKIEKIVPDPIPGDIVMYLINAIYFKGTWTTEFDPKNTRDDRFTLPDGSTVSCRMMNRKGKVSYVQNERFKAVDLPYGDAGYSMTIMLPTQGRSADDLVAALTPEEWGSLSSGFHDVELDLALPRFKVEYGKKLNDVLQAMGMAVAFNAAQADLSGIAGMPGDLYIDEVQHKSFIEVNEEGTEAAAATSVGVARTSLGPTMRVDRPFVFAIRERHSGTILFMGKIARPTL